MIKRHNSEEPVSRDRMHRSQMSYNSNDRICVLNYISTERKIKKNSNMQSKLNEKRSQKKNNALRHKTNSSHRIDLFAFAPHDTDVAGWGIERCVCCVRIFVRCYCYIPCSRSLSAHSFWPELIVHILWWHSEYTTNTV